VDPNLHGNMQKGVDSRVLQHLSHLLKVLQDIRWIGHAHTQHAVLGNHFHQLPEQLRQRASYIPTIGSSILGR